MHHRLPLVLLALVACEPTDRFFCGPGTHVDGDWCIPDAADTGTGDTSDTDTADTDTSTDTGTDTGTDTADSGTDTGDTADTGERPARVVINEFMADNDGLVADEAGEFDDWIEVYNAGSRSADLARLSLSNDSAELTLFTFPAGSSLAPGAFAYVWTDTTPDQGDLHAAFKLGNEGGTIYLSAAGAVIHEVSYEAAVVDVGRAAIPDGSETWQDTVNVTPGAANTP